MGLTIHYNTKFQGTQKELVKKLTKIRSICMDKPFEEVSEIKSVIITQKMINEWNFWQNYCNYPNNSRENLDKRDKALDELGISTGLMINLEIYNHGIKPKTQIVTFSVWAGEGCENTEYCFVKNRTNNKWQAKGFTKTQYAEQFVKCHLLVIKVLDMLKEQGFTVIVHDEGHYWKTRKLDVLAKNINDYTNLISSIFGSLSKQAETLGMGIEAPITECQNYMKVNNPVE
jgi:DNA modification methylase